MRQYHDLVRHVLATGNRKENRTSVDTLSTFGYYYEHDLAEGFPLLTTKKIAWKNIVMELLWFLSGSNRSGFLERHGCGFWRPWYNKPTQADLFQGVSDVTVNAAYGPAWRRFEYPSYRESETGLGYDGPCTGYNDQIKWVLNKLKTRPMARDLVVSAWQPHVAQNPPDPKAYLAPCHCMFILNVQNECVAKGFDPKDAEYKQRLCLHLTQRSCDVALGVPYNIASYALLLSLFSRFSGIEPGIFGHTLVDAHIYTSKADGSQSEFDHIPNLKVQLGREPRPLPKLHIGDSIHTLEDVERLLDPKVTTDEIMRQFVLEGYDPCDSLTFRVAV